MIDKKFIGKFCAWSSKKYFDNDMQLVSHSKKWSPALGFISVAQ